MFPSPSSGRRRPGRAIEQRAGCLDQHRRHFAAAVIPESWDDVAIVPVCRDGEIRMVKRGLMAKPKRAPVSHWGKSFWFINASLDS